MGKAGKIAGGVAGGIAVVYLLIGAIRYRTLLKGAETSRAMLAALQDSKNA